MKEKQRGLVRVVLGVVLLSSLPVCAATPAPEGYLDASKITRAPFDPHDATGALKAAVSSGAPKIWVPDMSVPWLIDTVWLASNQEILLEDGAVIESKPGSGFYTDGQLFKGVSLQNVTIKGYGATLKMRRDLFSSGKPYQPSEHRPRDCSVCKPEREDSRTHHQGCGRGWHHGRRVDPQLLQQGRADQGCSHHQRLSQCHQHHQRRESHDRQCRPHQHQRNQPAGGPGLRTRPRATANREFCCSQLHHYEQQTSWYLLPGLGFTHRQSAGTGPADLWRDRKLHDLPQWLPCVGWRR